MSVLQESAAASVTRSGVPLVARGQGGVFTASQAVAEGWTARQVRRRLASGQWQRLGGGALAASGSGLTPLGRAWAVTLRWPESVCILRTAALLWNLPVDDDGLVHVVGPAGRRARGARVYGVAVPADSIVTGCGGLRLTTRRRTVLDCLATLPFCEALDLHAWASSRHLVGRSDVCAALRQRVGRPGAGQLRRLLAVTASGAVSGAEYRLHGLLAEAEFTGWSAGVRVCDRQGLIGVVDVLFAEARLVIEVDGEASHSGREAFVRDRRRQNRLVNAGYRVLRFTWWDLVDRPHEVIREIREALAGGPRNLDRLRG